MYLYLLLKRQPPLEMQAAIDLFKEVHGVMCRGFAYGMGGIYATDHEVPHDEMEALGIIPWE